MDYLSQFELDKDYTEATRNFVEDFDHKIDLSTNTAEYLKRNIFELGASINEYDLIKQLTGKDARVLIDPTLALEREEWDIIQKKPFRFNDHEKYCICYFTCWTWNF